MRRTIDPVVAARVNLALNAGRNPRDVAARAGLSLNSVFQVAKDAGIRFRCKYPACGAVLEQSRCIACESRNAAPRRRASFRERYKELAFDLSPEDEAARLSVLAESVSDVLYGPAKRDEKEGPEFEFCFSCHESLRKRNKVIRIRAAYVPVGCD
jgi:hypothetical protein